MTVERFNVKSNLISNNYLLTIRETSAMTLLFSVTAIWRRKDVFKNI